MQSKAQLCLFAASLSLVCACASSSSPPVTATAGALGPAHFAWPMSVSVPVQETSVKGKSKAELVYRLEVCPADAGSFAISHRDVQFVSLDGRPGDDPSVAPLIRQIAPLLAAIPELVVRDDGRYQGVQGWDKVLDELEKAVPNPVRTGLKLLRDDQRFRELASRAVGHRWRTWVETWLEFDPSKGARQTKTLPVQLGSKPIDVSVEMTSKPGEVDGVLVLSATSRAEGAKAREMLTELLGVVGVGDLDPNEVEVVLIQDVETEWPSLRPRRAHYRKEIVISHEGKRRERVEDREYTFDWAAAEPARCDR